MSEPYVLDCTLETGADGLYCFCPVETDEGGEITSIVVGLNYLSTSPPDRGRFIGVVHADGQEACDAWCASHQDVIDRLVAERPAA